MRETYIRFINIFALIVAAFVFVTIIGPQSAIAQNAEILPPANDMFANAELIAGPKGYVFGTNVNATVEPNEPIFYNGGQTVWFRWMAPAELSVTFELRAFDGSAPGIAIYQGAKLQKMFSMGHGVHFDRVTFIAHAMVDYSIQVTSKSSDAAGPFELNWDINSAETWKQFNFDGPIALYTGPPAGKSDFAIHRWWSLSQSTGQWWVWQSNTGTPNVYNFGDHFLSPVHFAPGDYDGDGVVDIAFFRKQTGDFWIYRSSSNTAMVQPWGRSNDNPVQGDFDGDDMADIAIFRPNEATFWVLKSTDGRAMVVQWGVNGDHPVCGDYDGDGITDFAIKRAGTGNDQALYYLLRSSDGEMAVINFGFMDDMTVPGDYDGDGKNDIAVFRPGNSTFYVLRSMDREIYTLPVPIPFENGDRVVPGDYFGDARSDLVVWKFRTGDFHVYPDSGAGEHLMFHFGLQGDEPIGFSNVH